jgi:hypothetical protein
VWCGAVKPDSLHRMSKTILSKFVIFDSIDDLCHVRVLHGKNDIAVGWGLNPSSLVQSWHRFLVASGLWRTDVEESREKERARWSVRRKGIKGQALLLTSGSAIFVATRTRKPRDI